MREQIGKHIVAVLIPRASRGARITTEHDLERRIRRITGKIFVGINIDIGGMIDGEQSHLIEIDGFFEWLHEAKTEHIADELVVRAIPGEKRGTRASTTVEFSNALRLVGGNSDFILQNAGWPQHADNIRFFGLSQADS